MYLMCSVLGPALEMRIVPPCDALLQIDWDYHMRLSPRGTPFMDAAAGSIVHFQHFRWALC
jgi:hypothetical protein